MVTATLLFLVTAAGAEAPEPTYAERLGWPADARVVIFHIDDAGMSHSANLGSKKALTEGVATSVSIMMPCPWVPEFVDWVKENPEIDAGLHLTFTSEWDHYRWGPLAGAAQVPDLVDEDGAFYDNVPDVVANAPVEQVEIELRAQIDRARRMGLPITHLDSHMGTLFSSRDFIELYVRIGIEEQIPVLWPGGHLHYIREENAAATLMAPAIAKRLWDAGLPVVDDIHADSYGWSKEEKTDRYIEVLENMKPGILEIVNHCAWPTDEMARFTTSTDTRHGDTLAMLDPRLRQYIEDEGIILTTWRELMERRQAVAQAVAAAGAEDPTPAEPAAR